MISKPKGGILERMIEVYPMFKLCQLFREKENKWQRQDLDSRIMLQYRPEDKWNDEMVRYEREARITTGEAKSVSTYFLVNEYIKRYYPEHTKPSDAFGALVKMDYSKPKAESLKAEIMTIIDNCLSDKYRFLSASTEEDGTRVLLTGEGRSFASPPYLYLWKGMPINVGLVNGYLKALGESQTLFLNLIVSSLTLFLAWVLWGADLITPWITATLK